ncbi:uncharacterized protein LOC132934733 [Metopolophium dirhodum]|uniref:uncharacterized protein LOC132934733 n=1 Tax=Metopolophium dirhodum TaxID=44670 RepID=UPI0029907A6F|nr:uncharacterized protein LOC132934733 [Metopolophium dirhodum]
MTEKEVLFTKFFNDNFDIKSKNKLYTPIDYCRKRNFGNCGILGWISRWMKSAEKKRSAETEITEEYEDIETTILLPNKNGGGKYIIIIYLCIFINYVKIFYN